VLTQAVQEFEFKALSRARRPRLPGELDEEDELLAPAAPKKKGRKRKREPDDTEAEGTKGAAKGKSSEYFGRRSPLPCFGSASTPPYSGSPL